MQTPRPIRGEEAEAALVELLETAASLWIYTHPIEAVELVEANGATSSNAFLPWAEQAVLVRLELR